MHTSINPHLMRVNPRLLDAGFTGVETQPMVDKHKEETFADRFERLRGGMSYQALSDGIYRKTGARISAQALNKWTHGGNIDQDNVKPVCEFFAVNEAWLIYGTGPESKLSLEEIVNTLPPESAVRAFDFVKYQIERSATETELFAKEPERLGDYLKFIDRLINARKGKS